MGETYPEVAAYVALLSQTLSFFFNTCNTVPPSFRCPAVKTTSPDRFAVQGVLVMENTGSAGVGKSEVPQVPVMLGEWVG
jgi:hypothetical protein